MNPEFNRLQHQYAQDQQLDAVELHKAAARQGTEYSTVEELIRHDAAQVEVPPEIAIRLNESIAAEPRPAKPWFKKLFSS